MAWNLKSDRPIYIQIVEILSMRIISGAYPPGGKVPPVRELAMEAGVNPNTMQKALTDLERSGLIVTQRTSGRTVTEDSDTILKKREAIAREETLMYFGKMEQLGYSKEKAQEFAKQIAAKIVAENTAAGSGAQGGSGSEMQVEMQGQSRYTLPGEEGNQQ
ncbi:MAG: GntR family transcriptional regulator [Lachnospiraceae bacterium]|nr:GntR family transcriptional regulator [Lachnospiraceae bacterium]